MAINSGVCEVVLKIQHLTKCLYNSCSILPIVKRIFQNNMSIFSVNRKISMINVTVNLFLQNYFTHTRVDRHEVSFKVENNPEKKTAADVAKSINDSRFKNNLSRRLGVLVSRAGIGDKVKDYENLISSTKMETADDGPNVTRVMIYMIAGAGVSAVLVVSITLYLIHRHDQKKDKLGGLQTGLTAAETCSKDYQELCRARMAGKNNPETSTGRIASLTKENDRPPSSRSSTSSWSEEPALSNMDISTGHMVLVSIY